jgi:hypothetical protein
VSALPLQFLIVLVSSWLGRRQRDAIEYLRAENRLPRAKRRAEAASAHGRGATVGLAADQSPREDMEQFKVEVVETLAPALRLFIPAIFLTPAWVGRRRRTVPRELQVGASGVWWAGAPLVARDDVAAGFVVPRTGGIYGVRLIGPGGQRRLEVDFPTEARALAFLHALRLDAEALDREAR